MRGGVTPVRQWVVGWDQADGGRVILGLPMCRMAPRTFPVGPLIGTPPIGAAGWPE